MRRSRNPAKPPVIRKSRITLKKSSVITQGTAKSKKRIPGYDDLFESIKGLAESLQALNHQAVQAYTPIVDAILRSRSRDDHHIEHTLDGLLSFCCHEPALQLYKKLCRHYYFINLRSFQGGLEFSAIAGAVSPAYHVIYPIIEIDRDFYRQYFKTDDFVSRLAVTVIGIRDGKQVSSTDFGFLRLPYPNLAIQKKIGSILDFCDKELGILLAHRSALDQQKRGLMQELLTGKVRVCP